MATLRPLVGFTIAKWDWESIPYAPMSLIETNRETVEIGRREWEKDIYMYVYI